MQSEFSIVRQDRFIEATRDSGYKGTESALSELIDNAIQAGARNISIKMTAVEEKYQGAGRPKSPLVVEVAIADDGSGMDETTLRRALRFGDSSRFNDRSNLGRFGMGLPNSSVSQCKRVEVYSWQRNTRPAWTYIDVEEIARGGQTEVPQPEPALIPAPYEDIINPTKGTLVVWQKCDRLDGDGRIDTLTRMLRHGLGRIFRHFLVADLKITLNDIEIAPFDPLYLMPQARLAGDPLAMQYGDVLRFVVPVPNHPEQVSNVDVVISLVPEEWQTKYRHDKKERQKRHLNTKNNFSIVRARREIDFIRSPYHAHHWTDAWYRVEIRFDPILDEAFGVTNTKQHVYLDDAPIFEKLGELIVPNVATLKTMIIARSKKAHEARNLQAEKAVQKVLPLLRPIDELGEKTSSQIASEVREFVAQTAFEESSEERQQFEKRLLEYQVNIAFESLPGAPFYRSKVVGASIVALVNKAHRFYDRVYQRLAVESPHGKTGVELLIMALARSEAISTDEGKEWYDAQRQEWSQHLQRFVESLDEVDPDDLPSANVNPLEASAS